MDEPGAGWFGPAVKRLLTEVSVMTLATGGPDGPWAADVFFAERDLALYFVSSARSRHARELAAQPRCAVTVHPAPPTSWQQITGVQLSGQARALTGTEAARAIATYLRKFPFAKEVIAHPGATASRAANAAPFVFRPDRIRLIDNSRGFGRPFAADVLATGVLGTPTRDGREE